MAAKVPEPETKPKAATTGGSMPTTSSLAKMKAPALSLPDLVRSTMAASGHDVDQAADALVGRFLEDQAVWDGCISDVLRVAMRYLCRREVAAQRQRIWDSGKTGESPPADSGERWQAAAERLGRVADWTFYDWRLSTGQRLGDAKRGEVEAERDSYARRRAQNASREHFMASVAEKLPAADSVVSDVLTPEKLHDLGHSNGVDQ